MTTAAIIGGGFYGCSIALYLKRDRGLQEVVLLERADAVMGRSSFVNQARVHNGYHYPRSFTTAYRSRVNARRFLADFAPAVRSDFVQVYALARRNSKITPRQFERFCREIGAPLSRAPKEIARLFNPALIGEAYVTVEQAFDAVALRKLTEESLRMAGVTVRLSADVESIIDRPDGVTLRGEGFSQEADLVFNCAYSRLATTVGAEFPLKHEIAEMALVEPPPALSGLGVTVVDGPFFSCMPFPARGVHSLSHVRYTPHHAWIEDGRDPYAELDAYHRHSRADRMVRDAARYAPALADCRVIDSLFEVKTVLARNETDDARPILFERHGQEGRLFSVLGGKIDNIYDILERLDREPLPGEEEAPWTA